MRVIVNDKALQDLSVMFFDDPKDPTPDVQVLSKEKLDFTVNSLLHVEEYLNFVRVQKHTGRPFQILVLRAGAYVGEVICRHAKHTQWHWLNFEEAGKISPEIAKSPRTLDAAAILWDSKTKFCFPLGKVMKYLRNGEEDSVRFFAEVVINGSVNKPDIVPGP